MLHAPSVAPFDGRPAAFGSRAARSRAALRATSLAWFAASALVLATPSVALADARSESAAADLLHRRLKNEKPEDLELLRGVQGKDVVVVAGTMDHIEDVLRAARIKHTVIRPGQVAQYQLRSNMIVMVNCPGVMPEAGVRRLERFVRAGGLLYTTDWALANVVERGFPGTIRHNGKSTGDEVVPVQIGKHDDNLMSRMLLRRNAQPQWWLEGGSYPIKVADQTRVEVLASSATMGKRYSAAPVVVRVRWEDGEIIHVVSHFYRQMGTKGPAVAAKAAAQSFDGLTEKDKKEFAKQAGAEASVGDVESSYAFQSMTTNIVTGKQRRNVELDKMYDTTVKAPEPLRAAPAAAAPATATSAAGGRMRVLEERGDQARVRDEMGNEGWVGKAKLHKR
jgi:hypothetical protein